MPVFYITFLKSKAKTNITFYILDVIKLDISQNPTILKIGISLKDLLSDG